MADVMLVTGGSRGIGAAICRRAAQAGWDVAVNYHGAADKAAEVVAEIEAMGRRAIAVQADTADDDAVAAMFAQTARVLGPLKALINNAGVVEKLDLHDLDVARLRRMVEVNVIGCFICAHHALRQMSSQLGGTGGVIVNISSRAAASGGLPRSVGYAATKGAVDSFTLGLAKEGAPHGVRAAAIRPGLIHSDIHEVNGGREAVEAMARTGVPMARAGEPQEVAGIAVWLCGPEASYVSGALIDVGGGR